MTNLLFIAELGPRGPGNVKTDQIKRYAILHILTWEKKINLNF